MSRWGWHGNPLFEAIKNQVMNAFISAYIECALRSSTDDNGEPLDTNYYESDISEKTLAEMEADCLDFQEANRALLDASGLNQDQQGHDFWLTRNGHGVGFWDRGIGEIGTKLSDASKVYGSVDLFTWGTMGKSTSHETRTNHLCAQLAEPPGAP